MKPDKKAAKKPPKLWQELITAVPIAAEAPLRNNVGIAQKGPIIEVEPTCISTIPAIFATGLTESMTINAPAKQTTIEVTACIFLSPVLSECHAHRGIKTIANRLGIIPSSPTPVFDTLAKSLMISAVHVNMVAADIDIKR